MGANAGFVLEGEKGVVVDLGALASNVDLGVDVSHSAEELKSLIDEMAAEVVEEAARLGCPWTLAPTSPR